MTGAWALALRNLRRQRRRNLVTGVAIAVGYVALAVLFGYAGFVERLLRTTSVYMHHRGHVSVYARDGLLRADARPSRYALSPEAQAAIVAALRADPRVEHVGRYLLGGGIAGNGCKSFPVRTLGVEPGVEPSIAGHPDMRAIWDDAGAPLSGRPLWDAPGVEAPILLGKRLARFLVKDGPPAAPPPGAPAPLDCGDPGVEGRLSADPFVQLGARTQDGSFGAVDGQVVGVYRAATTEEAKTGVLAPLPLLQALLGTDRVSWIAAYLRDHRELPAFERALSERLRAAGVEASLHRYDDPVANPFLVRSMEMVGAMVVFIVLLVANVVAFSVLNATTLAVLERTREMGTLRALGFTQRQLRGLFLREAALLTVLATAAGAGSAVAVGWLVRWADFRFEPPGAGTELRLDVMPPAGALAFVAGFFVVLSVAAALVAVRRRVRVEVAALLSEVSA